MARTVAAIALAIGLALLGVGFFAYYALFLSWSHSYNSPGFQRRETLVLAAAAVSELMAVGTLIATLIRRRR